MKITFKLKCQSTIIVIFGDDFLWNPIIQRVSSLPKQKKDTTQWIEVAGKKRVSKQRTLLMKSRYNINV